VVVKNINLRGTSVAKLVRGVFLIDSLGSGGAQRQFVELVASLDPDGIRPCVVT